MNPIHLPNSHHWAFPLSGVKRIMAEVYIRGPSPGLAEIRTLQRFLELIARAWPETPSFSKEPQCEDLDPINVGDVVQLRPSADEVFGGLLLRVRKLNPIRGYLLLPRRGGALEAWTKVKPCEVGRIGALRWPEAEWGFKDLAFKPWE